METLLMIVGMISLMAIPVFILATIIQAMRKKPVKKVALGLSGSSAIFIICFMLTGTSSIEGASSEKYEVLQIDNATLQDNLTMFEAKLVELQAEFDTLSEMAEKYKDLSDSELEAQKQANILQAEQDKQESERLLEEAPTPVKQIEDEATSKADAEGKAGYETGITFEQLARTPDDYEDQKVKFTGTVVQVMEEETEIHLRVEVNGDYNDVLYVSYSYSMMKTRVLVNDTITLYGTSKGLYSYNTTMGVKITIPFVVVDKIEIN